MKILLHTSIAGKDENGIGFSWEADTEQDCEEKYAQRLVDSGQASYVKAPATRKTTKKKAAAKTA